MDLSRPCTYPSRILMSTNVLYQRLRDSRLDTNLSPSDQITQYEPTMRLLWASTRFLLLMFFYATVALPSTTIVQWEPSVDASHLFVCQFPMSWYCGGENKNAAALLPLAFSFVCLHPSRVNNTFTLPWQQSALLCNQVHCATQF